MRNRLALFVLPLLILIIWNVSSDRSTPVETNVTAITQTDVKHSDTSCDCGDPKFHSSIEEVLNSEAPSNKQKFSAAEVQELLTDTDKSAVVKLFKTSKEVDPPSNKEWILRRKEVNLDHSAIEADLIEFDLFDGVEDEKLFILPFDVDRPFKTAVVMTGNILDKDGRPVGRIEMAIVTPVSQDVGYAGNFVMHDGRQFGLDSTEGDSLYLDELIVSKIPPFECSAE